MVATWQGAAAQDYQVRQKQWDTAAADLTAVLGQIGVALGAANDGYQQAEHANAAPVAVICATLSAVPAGGGGGRFDPAPDRRVPSFFDVQWVKLRAARSPGVPAAPAHQTPFERTPAGEARAQRQQRGRSVSTYSPKPGDITHAWHVIDATDVVLGRLAAQAATLLRGKHKPMYAPHMDTGDFVVIVNAEKVAVTGNKRTDKFVYRHSGYPGGLRQRSVGEMLEKQPDRLVEKAIKGMLPKNRLGRAMGKKLKVYAGPEHPHAAQKPTPYEIHQVAQ